MTGKTSKSHQCSQVKQIVDVMSASVQSFIPFLKKYSIYN